MQSESKREPPAELDKRPLVPGRDRRPRKKRLEELDADLTLSDDITRIVREEFGRGNDFCQKITYRTTGKKPDEILGGSFERLPLSRAS